MTYTSSRQASAVPGRDHRPRCVARRPLLPALSGCRGAHGRTRRDAPRRSGAVVVLAVRADLCQPMTPPASSTRRHVASRGRRPDRPERAPVSGAGRGAGRPGPGDAQATAARHERRAAVLAQTPDGGARRAAGAQHRSRGERWGGEARELAARGTAPAPVAQAARGPRPPPTRQRERTRRRVTAAGHAQRCLSAHGPIVAHCRPPRPRLGARA